MGVAIWAPPVGDPSTLPQGPRWAGGEIPKCGKGVQMVKGLKMTPSIPDHGAGTVGTP